VKKRIRDPSFFFSPSFQRSHDLTFFRNHLSSSQKDSVWSLLILSEFSRGILFFCEQQNLNLPNREKDLYAIIIYQTMIQVTKILASDEEKSLVESLRFSKDGEKISAVSETWDETSSISFTISTNKNSIYLIQVELRVVDLRLHFALTSQIFNRKIKFIQKLNQKIKTYTGLSFESDVDHSEQAFCNMQRKTTDLARSSIHNYEVLSYVGGKLELFSINLEHKNDRYHLSSNIVNISPLKYINLL